MAEQNVTLQPGESKAVSFEMVPSVAKTFNVSIDGLSGSFRAVAAPKLPFTYTFSCTRGSCPPMPSYGIAQMNFTIRNNNSVAVSQNVKVMWAKFSKSYGQWVDCFNQFSGSRVNCLCNELNVCMMNPFPVTLAPGAQQSYSHPGYCGPTGQEQCYPTLYQNYNYYFWLEDDAGGKSNEVILST